MDADTTKEEPQARLDFSKLTYSEASAELERIVKLLESNQLELEESLDLYQRGVALLADLRGRLEGAEQRVSVLLGTIDEEDEETSDPALG